MAQLTNHFREFHATIGLDEPLRDRIVAAHNAMRDFAAADGPLGAVLQESFLQGSVRHGTAIWPLRGEFDVDVVIRAPNAKDRREARLPLRPATAKALKAYVGQSLPMARVFELFRWWPAAAVLGDDLALAGIVFRDDAGRVVDFHSLRVTFATNLARSRVPLQLAQRVMRHSDPRLTSSIYTVLNSDDERDAVAALPDLDVAPPARDAARATGTDDAARTGAPSDARVDALIAAWSGLDEPARDALLHSAKALGRG